MFQAKKYLTNDKFKRFVKLYGISQNPDTKDYFLVQNNFIWENGNEEIDNFIQEMQLNDIIFEWIPYSQFNGIKETGKNDFTTVYSAIWRDGPLYYNYLDEEYTRDSNKQVVLKCLQNSQNSNLIEFLINEVKHKISTNIFIFLSIIY